MYEKYFSSGQILLATYVMSLASICQTTKMILMTITSLICIGSTLFGYVVSGVVSGTLLAWQECHDRSYHRLPALPPGRTRRQTRHQPHRNRPMPLQGL